MRLPRTPLGTVALVVAAVAVTGTAFAAFGSGAGRADPAEGVATGPIATAVVERTTLLLQEEVDGTLGYGESSVAPADVAGKVTQLAAEGSVVERGGVLLTVDGRAARLLYGGTPLHRTLAAGVADGPDVRVLEENLVALGYGAQLGAGPDDDFTARTARALRRWQSDTGVAETGRLELGAVVVAPAAVRVAEHVVDLGAAVQPGAPVLRVTGTTPVVTIALDARKVARVAVGDPATVRLPDGRETAGTVQSVATVAVQEDGGAAGAGEGARTVTVVVAFDDAAERGALDGAPVEVAITRGRRESVLAVPVEALLVQADGSYVLHAVAADGGRSVVPVTTGSFAQGKVEVDGEGLQAGTRVVVPS